MTKGHSLFHKLQDERKKVSLLEEELEKQRAIVKTRDRRIGNLMKQIADLEDDDIPF